MAAATHQIAYEYGYHSMYFKTHDYSVNCIDEYFRTVGFALRTQNDWQFTLGTKPKDTHLRPFDSHQALNIWKQKLHVKEKPSTLISLENTTLPIINTNLIKQPVDTLENQEEVLYHDLNIEEENHSQQDEEEKLSWKTRTWDLNLQQLHLSQPNLSKCNQQSRTQTVILCSTSVPTTSTVLPITALQQ
ncbi:hypothetical protein G6F43_005036 [Rhizopus delemar]|nr:hypothetical protein G6F43_005036 [Rhizopus delemar]